MRIRKRLAAGTMTAAFAASAKAPPPWLAPLLGQMSSRRWSWLVRSVESELRQGGAVEPEPQEEDNGFNDWVESVAGMTALILRHFAVADATRREAWAATIDQNVVEVQADAEENAQAEILASEHQESDEA